MIDKRLSHFEILEKLGSGGMGVVYRAFDERLRRNVALKLLHQGALADAHSRERFIREAQTASGLNHRNIVTIHQIEEVDGRDFIAMELVDGHTLDEVVGEEGLELERALRYGIQIGEALACAHEHGVVHRDLKPHNVMLSADGEIKVLDFGLAKHIGPADSADGEEETDEDSAEGGRADLLGTPAYMSPEQAQSKRIDARSDIFSFGVLFYEMLTAVKLFKRRTPVGILTAILQQEVDPPSQTREGLPEELDRIVLRALAKDPDQRYQTMRELVEDLERLSNQLYGTAFFTLPSPPSFWERNRGRLMIAGLILLIGTAGLSFWLGRGSGIGGPELENFRLLSTFPGSHREASLATDGDRVAFVNDDGTGIPQLWLMSLEGGDPRALTRDPSGVERPRFHPDGERIFYGRKGGGIWALTLDSDQEPVRVLEEGSWPHLSTDGSMLVYERDKRIWIAGSDGSNAKPIESIPPNYFAEWVRMGPTFSPDGERIVYFAAELGPKGHLWIAPVSGGDPVRLTEDRFYGGHPVFTPDGRNILFQANFEGALTLWSLPAGGGEPHPVTSGAGEDAEPILSADGQKLIYTASRHTYTLTRVGSGSDDQPRVLFESRLPVATPDLSPDETHLAFLWAEAADYQIATLDLHTGDVRQMTLGAGQDNIIPQWSRDGEWIYYYQDRPVRSLQRVPSGSGPSEIVMDGWHWAIHNGASPSPDGRYLAYSLFEEGQWAATRLHHLETGEELELAGRLRKPRWSPDGTLLLGYDDTDQTVRLCPVDGGDCRDIDSGFQPQWVDADTIAFARPTTSSSPSAATRVEIWWRDLETEQADRLAVVSGVQPLLFDFAVSQDGEVYWNQDRPGKQELWVATVR